MRRELSSRMSTVYTALIPSSLSAASLSSTSLGNHDLFAKGRPQTGKDWLLTALGSYVGWKAIGVLPFVVVVGVFFALRGGREEGVRGGARVAGERSAVEGVEGEKGETGVGLRSSRTDVQVVG